MFNQIKLRLELADPQVQSSKIQSTFRFWVTQLACVINRTACRSILAGASSLVDSANVMLHNVDTADQHQFLVALRLKRIKSKYKAIGAKPMLSGANKNRECSTVWMV